MGGCRAGLRERRFVGRASPPPLPPPTPPSPLLPRYLRSGVPSAFAGGIGPQSAANTLNRVQQSISQDSAIPGGAVLAASTIALLEADVAFGL